MGKGGTGPMKGKSLPGFPGTFTVIDIETTGLSPVNDDVIEPAALRVEDGAVTDSFARLVNPGYGIPPFISSLTGITNRMLKDAGSIEDALPDYLEFTGGDGILAGHNVNFDISFIYEKRMLLEGRPLTNDFVDMLRLARRLLPKHVHKGLSDLSRYYNIDVTGQHRAPADCCTTLELPECLREEARRSPDCGRYPDL